MFGRRGDAQPTAPVYEPMPPGTVRDPEAVEDESPAPGTSDEDRYW